MIGTDSLVQTEVLNMLNHVSTLLSINGCSKEHVNLVNDLKNSVMERRLFHRVRNKKKQIKYFQEKFGLILPEQERLPTVPGQLKKRRETDPEQTENSFYRIQKMQKLSSKD